MAKIESAKQHLVRAEYHHKVARALSSAEGSKSEWSAVVYFYAAYHYVKHALLVDPVFSDLKQLESYNKGLCFEDRNVSRHQGRSGGKHGEKGLNDLVRILYPAIRGSYHRLHQASIAVRYDDGVISLPADRIKASLDEIVAAHENGGIVAVPPLKSAK